MADNHKNEATPRVTLSHATLVQWIIVLAMIVGIVVTGLTCVEESDLVDVLLWVVAVFAPYGLLMLAGFRYNGLPKMFRNKVFAVLYMSLIVLSWIFMPWILMVLTWVYIALGALLLLKVFSFFGPSGFVDVTTTYEGGRTTHETHAVYGDVDAEARRLEIELSDRKGRTEIKKR